LFQHFTLLYWCKTCKNYLMISINPSKTSLKRMTYRTLRIISLSICPFQCSLYD
jgi:hypothetical protein